MQEAGGFGKPQVVVPNEGRADLDLRQIPLCKCGGLMRHLGKDRIHRSHGPLGPLLLHRFREAILEHDLHQPVQVEYLPFGITLDQ